MWVKAKEKEKNKEKHVNGAMFLTGAVSPRTPNLLKIVVGVRRVANDDDIADIGKINAHHEDISGDDYSAAILFPHELLCPEVVVRPVQGIICPQLLALYAEGRIELAPEVREDLKPIPDAHTKDDYLLSSHVVDNPLKVGKLPVLDAMAEDTEEELDLWLLVRPPYDVVVSESDELTNSISLAAREQCGCHRNRD
jgi:hypothetical protein